jgi:hypothetical protein
MRRSQWSGLLFALALAIQAFAPVAANIAMAHGFGLETCIETSGGGSANHHHQHRLPGHDDPHGGACPLCQACCSGVAPIEARPSVAGMVPVQWTPHGWTVADRALPAPHRDHTHEARAPPAFS